MIRIVQKPTLETRGPVDALSVYRECIKLLDALGMVLQENRLRRLALYAEDVDELFESCELFVDIKVT